MYFVKWKLLCAGEDIFSLCSVVMFLNDDLDARLSVFVASWTNVTGSMCDDNWSIWVCRIIKVIFRDSDNTMMEKEGIKQLLVMFCWGIMQDDSERSRFLNIIFSVAKRPSGVSDLLPVCNSVREGAQDVCFQVCCVEGDYFWNCSTETFILLLFRTTPGLMWTRTPAQFCSVDAVASLLQLADAETRLSTNFSLTSVFYILTSLLHSHSVKCSHTPDAHIRSFLPPGQRGWCQQEAGNHSSVWLIAPLGMVGKQGVHMKRYQRAALSAQQFEPSGADSILVCCL